MKLHYNQAHSSTRRQKNSTFLSIAMSVCVLLPNLAHADCSVSATAVNFNVYDPLLILPTTAVGNIQISCTFLLGLFVATETKLSTGNSGSYNPRRMLNGAETLNYNLYTGPLFTTVWGDGTGGTQTVPGFSLLVVGTVTENQPVYGRIPATQSVIAGSYQDNITVTVTF